MGKDELNKIVFGPVPSRRLGRSLGINNVPPKVCSYSCIYCQVGATSKKLITREIYYSPDQIYDEVKNKVDAVGKKKIDYLTFVSDGEPTLNINLCATIEKLKQLEIKIAIISNASLLWREEIKEAMNKADFVSLKVDAADEKTWKMINCPHRSLNLDVIQKHVLQFSKNFNGELHTETMLVKGVNDNEESLERIAKFISKIKPKTAHLAIPTRPPLSNKIYPAGSTTLRKAARIFRSHDIKTKYLNNYEGNDFVSSDNIEQDLLTITAVHPMRKDAVGELLKNAGKKWNVVNKLIEQNEIEKKKYNGNIFYRRKFRSNIKEV